MNDEILSEINDLYGTSYRIRRCKTMNVKRATSVSFDGCRMRLALDVS